MNKTIFFAIFILLIPLAYAACPGNHTAAGGNVTYINITGFVTAGDWQGYAGIITYGTGATAPTTVNATGSNVSGQGFHFKIPCNNPLSIFDVDRSIWVGQIEEVFFICPKCNSESKFVSRLFEKDHISKSFLEMLMNDCEKKEKHLNYLPNEQRSALLTHLVSCQYCTEKLEEMKLTKILKEMRLSPTERLK